jgi:hypothetical protein
MKLRILLTFIGIAVPIFQGCRQPTQRILKQNAASSGQPTANGQSNQQSTDSETMRSILAVVTQIQKQEAEEQKEEATNKQQTINVEWWLVWVAIAQAVALTLTLIAMLRQTGVLKDSAQRQLRAYVGISKCSLKLEPANIPEGQVCVQNFGQTPAHKVRQWINIRIAPYPLTFTLPELEDLQGSLFTVWPGGYTTSVATQQPTVPPHVLPHLGSDQYTVYVCGKIIYEDIFGKEQYTYYRFIYGGPGGTKTETDSHGWLIGLMKPDSAGNDAT